MTNNLLDDLWEKYLCTGVLKSFRDENGDLRDFRDYINQVSWNNSAVVYSMLYIYGVDF